MNFIQELVATHQIAFSAALLMLAYLFIATEIVSKPAVAILGACIAIASGLVSQNKLLPNGAPNPEYFVNFIDFNVIFLLISMMIIVSVTARSGIFNYIANSMLRFTGGHPVRILFALASFTAFISAFLDNVTTVILVMPLTFAISKKLGISAMPFLLAEIFSSNIGGTSTLIGDPPNIIIGSAAGFSFGDFIRELTLAVLIIFLAVSAFLIFAFRKHLRASPERMLEVARIENDFSALVNFPLMLRSLAVLSFVIIGFVLRDAIGLDTCIVALIGAGILLVFEKPADVFRDVEWNTIFFFIGLFIIVGALEASGGIRMMADWILKITDGSQSAASVLILWASGVISGVIDNIPYTATMSPLIAEIQKSMGAEYAHPLWWCLSLGACLGGNMTIIGAAANVIVSENAARYGEPISFMRFMKYGVVTVAISLSISTIYIWARFL